jgi:hypothetical protein
MTKKAHPNDIGNRWLKVKTALEADYLDVLSEEEIAQELDRELESMSDLEQKRAAKSLQRLEQRIRAIAETERARLGAYHQHGERAAADHGAGAEVQPKPLFPYAPLSRPRQIVAGGRTFNLGVAKKRPREVVLVGPMPEHAVALRVGIRRIALVRTNDPNIYRCRELGEPELKPLLDTDPLPEIEIIVDDKA